MPNIPTNSVGFLSDKPPCIGISYMFPYIFPSFPLKPPFNGICSLGDFPCPGAACWSSAAASQGWPRGATWGATTWWPSSMPRTWWMVMNGDEKNYWWLYMSFRCFRFLGKNECSRLSHQADAVEILGFCMRSISSTLLESCVLTSSPSTWMPWPSPCSQLLRQLHHEILLSQIEQEVWGECR